MDSKRIWNALVEHYNKNKHSKEHVLQEWWERIFVPSLGYQSLFGEIDSQRQIQIGSRQRTIPDIIVRSNDEDLFIIELKQYSNTINSSYSSQLQSYMDLLHISCGILICDAIYLFVYFNDRNSLKSLKIDFISNNFDGVCLLDLLEKQNFNREAILKFILEKEAFASNVEAIRKHVSSALLIELLTAHFLASYSENEVKAALSGFDVLLSSKDLPCKTASPQEPTMEVSSVPTNISMDRKTAIELFSQQGFPIKAKQLTFASFGSKKYYWANPRPNIAESEWFIILNDTISRTLHLLIVPAKSPDMQRLKKRPDNRDALDLAFVLDGSKCRELKSGVSFDKYYTIKLDY